MKIGFITGPPGSGKDHLSRFIKSIYRATILTTSEILDRSRDVVLPSGETIGAAKDRGEIVQTQIVVKLLKEEIKRQKGELVIVNGFPRDIDQAKFLESEKSFESLVFYLEINNRDICTDRILRSSDRGERKDDSPDKIKSRQDTFERETLPCIKYLKGRGIVPVVTLDGKDSGESNSFLIMKNFLDVKLVKK